MYCLTNNFEIKELNDNALINWNSTIAVSYEENRLISIRDDLLITKIKHSCIDEKEK